MRTEEDLRGAYEQLADDAPEVEAVLAPIRQERRRTPRRRLTAIALVAATAVSAAIVAPLLLSQGPRPVEPTRDRAPNPAWNSRFHINPPKNFHLTHELLTPTYHQAVVASRQNAYCEVYAYAAGAYRVPKPSARTRPISVNGSAGLLINLPLASDRIKYPPTAIWQYAPDSWATAHCRADDYSSSDARSLAAGVVIGSTRSGAPVKITYWPGAAPLLSMHRSQSSKAHSDSRRWPTDIFSVGPEYEAGPFKTLPPPKPATLSVGLTVDSSLPAGDAITINGFPGVVTTNTRATVLHLQNQRSRVTITMRNGLVPDVRGELMRIAAGLDLSPDPYDRETWFDAATAIP